MESCSPLPIFRYNQKLNIMRNVLVTTALQLYIDTLPLEEMSVDHPEFHNLYSKECQLFDLLRQMDWEEGEEYRHQVRCYNIDNKISNTINWREYKQSDEPEYDSAGFTEEDRIVNGQYRNREN